MNKFKKYIYFMFRDYGYTVMDGKRDKLMLFMATAYDYYMIYYDIIKKMRKRF